jgi:hypothetical protein
VHVILVVFGALLLLFGGGCVLIMVGVAASDPRGFFGDLALTLSLLVPLGLLPLAAGYFLVRGGLRMRNRKRGSRTPSPRPPPAPDA